MAYKKSSTKSKSGKKNAKTTVKSKSKMPITISNPFNSRVLNPKINDGVVPYSTGVRCQFATEYPTFGGGSPMIMYLFPGLTTGLTVFRSSLPSFGNMGVYPNHIVLGRNTAGQVVQQSSTAITHWRTVSQALRLTLINNCEANDGWFEAIRIDTPEETAQWDFVNQGAAVNNIQEVAVCPKQVRDETNAAEVTPADPLSAFNTGAQNVSVAGHDVQRMGSYATHPTYVTGKLKDIHKYIFQLRPNRREHEMTQLPPVKESVSAAADGLIDNNFDSIIIKIYGRSFPSTANADEVVNTRIHAHLISNQEIVFDEQTPLSRYHTNCRYNESEVMAAKRANTQYVKAAYVSKVK